MNVIAAQEFKRRGTIKKGRAEELIKKLGLDNLTRRFLKPITIPKEE